jgi:hypothetical protein
MSSTLSTPVITALTPSYALPGEPVPRNRVAAVGLGLAIAGLVVAAIPFATFFAWVLTLPALVLGIIGATRRHLPRRAAGWAIALATAGWIVSIAMTFVTFAAFGTITVDAGA